MVIARLIAVDSAAIGIHHHRHIFRTLHAAFDFIADHTGFDKLRQNSQSIHILGAQQILTCVLALQHILALSVQKLVGQTAGLSTTASIAAATANKAAHQALAAVAHAQRTMDEGFDFRATAAGSFDLL